MFLLSHGASHSISLRIPGERKAERLRALLELSTSTYSVMFASLALTVVFGIVAGFSGNWWGQGWIWAALVLLVVISAAMYSLGQRHLAPLRRSLGMPIMGAGKPQAAEAPASDDDVAALAAATKPLPGVIFGVVGLAVILWLMLFKPF